MRYRVGFVYELEVKTREKENIWFLVYSGDYLFPVLPFDITALIIDIVGENNDTVLLK